jgi:hypothetical protein
VAVEVVLVALGDVIQKGEGSVQLTSLFYLV